jgi:glycosyltransferase involved in cell wall biosynthesis
MFGPGVDGKEVRKRYEVSEGQSLVLFVGRLVPHKGVQHLIRAAGLIENKDIKFVVAGDGPLLDDMKDELKRMSLTEKVRLAGKVPYKELPNFYAACDMFTLPSTSRLEAFGIAALEAMSSGKPVVVSDIPGVREVIQDGRQGLLTKALSPEDLADKIKYLHENPTERKRMGALARGTVEEKYSWEMIVERIENAYKDTISINERGVKN